MLGIRLTMTDNTIRDIAGGMDLPILTLDWQWLALFPREFKNETIKECETRILELMKEEARIREQMKDLAKRKSYAIDKINELASRAILLDDKNAKREVKRSKAIILKANSFFLIGERRIAAIGAEIKAANKALLEETIRICYNIMKASKERMDVLSPEITEMREVLRKKVSEYSACEQHYDETYMLLHKLIGRDCLNRLDMEMEALNNKKWFWA